LIRDLRGEPSIFLEKELTEKKMIATTRMFGRPVKDIRELKESVATYVCRAAEKLRRQRSAARTVTVFLVPREADPKADYSRSASLGSHKKMPEATSMTQELIKAALDLVHELFEPGKEYNKAGVVLGGLVPDASIQGNLFVPESQNQQRQLMEVIDNVNFSMRDDTVKFLASGLTRNWKMRQELRSGRYSTRWAELRQVR
jgi:DNA polymerase V